MFILVPVCGWGIVERGVVRHRVEAEHGRRTGQGFPDQVVPNDHHGAARTPDILLGAREYRTKLHTEKLG